jgi:hypothetical protein
MTDYSRIFSSSPVNATAAKVVGRSGIQWEPIRSVTGDWDVVSETPLPTRPFRGHAGHDLTGQKRGRLTIIGQSHRTKANAKGVAWVVKCTCGSFAERRTSGWKKMAEDRAMCARCQYQEWLKLGMPVVEPYT